MPIPFSSIPEKIRVSIAQKKNAVDFMKFSQSSREAYITSGKVKTRFPMMVQSEMILRKTRDGAKYFSIFQPSHLCFDKRNLNAVPLRVVGGCLNLLDWELTSELCDWLTDFIATTQSSFEHLQTGSLNCSFKKLNNLFLKSKIFSFANNGITPVEFLRMPIIAAQFKNLFLNSCPLNDDDVANLRIDSLILSQSNITAPGINRVLKDWVSGRRNLDMFMVAYAHRQLKIVDIFKGIKYSTEQSEEKTHFFVKNNKNEWITGTVSLGPHNKIATFRSIPFPPF